MEQKQRITDYLIKKYQPVAIVLHGSRARGMERLNSDWDLYVFVDRDGVNGDPELWEGESLDIDVVKLPVSEMDFIETFLGTLQVTEILYEVSGAVRSLLATAQEIYARPYPLSSERLLRRKNYVHRLLLRLEGYQTEPELFAYYLAQFYEELFRYWYELQGEWSQPVYLAWPRIQIDDPAYATLLTLLAGPSDASSKIQAAKQLRQRLFPA